MELQLQELDYWAIGIYILLMAGIGLSFGCFIKDVGAYFKGNGTTPGCGHRYDLWIDSVLLSSWLMPGLLTSTGWFLLRYFGPLCRHVSLVACGLADVGGGLVASLPSNIWNSVIVSLFAK